MQSEERALILLAKGDLDKLTAEEKQWLIKNLDSTELKEYTDLISNVTAQLKHLVPRMETKTQLLEKFRSGKYSDFENKVTRFTPFRIAVASIVILVGIGSLFLFLNNNEEQEYSALSDEEFIKFTQSEDFEKEELSPDSVKSETKFLMTMDFFSNSSISVHLK
jgi:hypothetical protein